jgi:hypothetical protein
MASTIRTAMRKVLCERSTIGLDSVLIAPRVMHSGSSTAQPVLPALCLNAALASPNELWFCGAVKLR